MATRKQTDWPVLTHYDQDHLSRIALPLGGIGTGTVSLGGRGNLHDWEIMNGPAKGFTPDNCFFALYAKPEGGEAVARCLEGPIPVEQYQGQVGSIAPSHGYPRFRHCSFDAAYPFGQVNLSDPDVPVDVTLKAFNPLVPADADSSGIPMAVLRFTLTNKTNKRVQASVCGSLPNLVGSTGTAINGNGTNLVTKELGGKKINRYKEAGRLRGIQMSNKGLSPKAVSWGTVALSSTSPGRVTYRTGWTDRGWNHHRWQFWQDLLEDGALDNPSPKQRKHPVASLNIQTTLAPKATKEVEFLLTWHFPNRAGWRHKTDENNVPEVPVGNYYTEQYKDAWAVAAQSRSKLRRLEAKTIDFVHSFCSADLPQAVKEAALNNLSTLRSQTVFRTPDGRLYGWEGCSDCCGCCHGSCTHVWNYEQSTAFLFGELAQTMREVEFMHAVADNGKMSFRVELPIEQEKGQGKAAADGQMGCLMKLYRDWQLSGNDAMLKAMWPKAKAALAFCWVEGGWDADQDGVMEGCQHNTMDVEYYGPNPQMTGWYLGALRAAEEMATYLGDTDFAERCRALFKSGSAWMDAHLFNGDYYEHEIRLPGKNAVIAEGLTVGMGSTSDWQLGGACLVDQLVGQYMAHICGLGYLHNRSKVRKTLKSIYTFNFKKSMHDHMNCMRTYALQEESATLMASYPYGKRPEKPFPYFTEVMTGFEYTAAIGMLYEGQTKNGMELITAIRDRYDGRKRSPFDEAECGHHYARAMAAWAAMLALTGFHYSAVEKRMRFAATPGNHFWSTGYAWGTCTIKKTARGHKVELKVQHGKIALQTLTLTRQGEASLPRARTLRAGQTLSLTVRPLA